MSGRGVILELQITAVHCVTTKISVFHVRLANNWQPFRDTEVDQRKVVLSILALTYTDVACFDICVGVAEFVDSLETLDELLDHLYCKLGLILRQLPARH